MAILRLYIKFFGSIDEFDSTNEPDHTILTGVPSEQSKVDALGFYGVSQVKYALFLVPAGVYCGSVSVPGRK